MTSKNSINRMVLILFSIVSFAFIAGCGEKGGESYYPISKQETDGMGDVAADPIILSFGTTRSDYIMAPYAIEDARVDGDDLYLQVSYTGGCEEHLFELVALNDFLASQPVQADLLLTHDANMDNCESLVKEDLKFSLLSIKEEYKIVFKTDTGSLTLRIQDPENPDSYSTLVYSF